ncbi:MAG: hypothetical protein ACRCTZ_21925 [Sarcina sp.]
MEEAREMLGKLYEEFGLNEVTLKASQLLDDLVMREVNDKYAIPNNAN